MLDTEIPPRTITCEHLQTTSPRAPSTCPPPAARLWLRNLMAASLIMLVMASFFVSSRQVSAQESVTLRCQVESAAVEVDSNVTLFIEVVNVDALYGYELTLDGNERFVVSVNVDAPVGLYGVQFNLTYDDTKLNVLGVNLGSAWPINSTFLARATVSGAGTVTESLVVGISVSIIMFMVPGTFVQASGPDGY